MAEAAGFDVRRYGLIGGVVLVVVFGVLFFTFRSCAPVPKGIGYTVIYSNLDLRDAANVIARLKELAIPYDIREEGKAIAVPKEKADQARLGLAEKNLPLGGVVGWEIFDQTRMGATDFDRRIQLIRAISGELSRTIRRIEGVDDVRVQIVIPETNLFAATVAPVTASVLLRLQPGIELSKEKINGIVHLVSSSVENLQPENVTVVDDTGNILSANLQPSREAIAAAPVPPPAQQPVMMFSPEAVPQEQNINKMNAPAALTSEAQTKLTTTGSAAAVVKGAASTEITAVASMTAEERIILKAQAKKDIERDLSGKAQELVNRFFPPNSIIVKVNVEIQPAKESEIKAKDLKVKRLEAIVLVDNRIDLNPKLKQATFTTIAAATGYDKKRGDKIILQLVPFHLAVPVQPIEPSIKEKAVINKITPVISIRGIIKWALLVLFFFAVIWLVVAIVNRGRNARLEAESREEEAPLAPAPARPVREKMPALDQIRSQAEANPEKIAELLKNWLSE